MTKTTKKQKRVAPDASAAGSALGKLGGAVRGKCKSRGTAHARRIATLRWFRQWLGDAEKRGDQAASDEFRHRIARLEQKTCG